MEKNIEIKQNYNLENLIGFLLIIPIYILLFVVLSLLLYLFRINISLVNILPVIMYLPIIIGLYVSYRNYKNKINKIIGVFILVFLIIGLYLCFQAYVLQHDEWDSLGYFLLWFINETLLKIFLCIFYGKITGWKKAIIFLGIYILCIFSSAFILL